MKKIIKFLDYVKTDEFKNKQRSRGWKLKRENGGKRRPTKHVWDGERSHFRKHIDKEKWDRVGIKRSDKVDEMPKELCDICGKTKPNVTEHKQPFAVVDVCEDCLEED